MTPDLQLLYRTYDAFNARDIDTALTAMTPDVEWPTAWEGGWVHGHDEIRAYWTRQWKEISPRVVPIGFMHLPDGRLRLDVQQTVRDLDGNLVAEAVVQHTYTFRDGLVAKMELGS